MVCNFSKSRLGGIGKGGLLEGEPRSDPNAWNTYRRWIEDGAQQAAVRRKPSGKGYISRMGCQFRSLPGSGTRQVLLAAAWATVTWESTSRWVTWILSKRAQATSDTSTMKTGLPGTPNAGRNCANGGPFASMHRGALSTNRRYRRGSSR